MQTLNTAKMMPNRVLPGSFRARLLLPVLVCGLVCGCSAHGSSAATPPAVTAGAQSHPSAGSAGGPAAPGRLTVRGSGVVLEITGAVADAATGELRMTIRNASSIPEELAMVEGPDGAQATLTGDSSDDGSLSTAGIELDPNTTTVFGAKGGPEANLPDRSQLVGRGTVPLVLEFGVGGLVHMVANVS